MAAKEPTIVVQEDETGCGIACAAMLAGKPYHEAKKRGKSLGIFSDDRSLYTDLYHLRPLLESYNIRIGKKVPFRSWTEVPSPAIVAMNYRADIDADSWHWAVFHRGDDGPVILDPCKKLKRNVRKDLGKVKPRWYIPVHGSTKANPPGPFGSS